MTFVEQFMDRLNVCAAFDADLNRASKPAMEKLKMLPELLNVMKNQRLQRQFLDAGVLHLLRSWLEPLPDGSLPSIDIRYELFKLLTDLPVDVKEERREQLKKSGLGNAVIFLSRLPEETLANKNLARNVVDKWSRLIFQRSARYEDLGHDERPPPRRMPVKKPVPKLRMDESTEGDLKFDLELPLERELKPGDVGYRHHASIPQPHALDIEFISVSEVDEERVASTLAKLEKMRRKLKKKLRRLKRKNKRSLQASRLKVSSQELSEPRTNFSQA